MNLAGLATTYISDLRASEWECRLNVKVMHALMRCFLGFTGIRKQFASRVASRNLHRHCW